MSAITPRPDAGGRDDWWVSCPRLTAWAQTDARGVIVDAAPIFSRFRRQPFANLVRWVNRITPNANQVWVVNLREWSEQHGP